ncbi:DUF4190 domain-containing protein [Streptomyces sp. NPDC053427]|uniref:DUF4190 domain-containing protein n=1 Tax=Streptomyces sp. NPDC053427 TaxID=3365701 RepID=UPI0037D76D73
MGDGRRPRDRHAARGPYAVPAPPPAPNSANRPHYLTHPAYSGPASHGGYPGHPGRPRHPASLAPRGPLAHPAWLPARPGNGFGTAALVVGIVGALLGVSIVPGILLGVLAIAFGAVGRARQRRGTATNGGTAVAGIVLGGLALLISGAMITFIAAGR